MGTEIWSYTCSLVPSRNYVGLIMLPIYIGDLPRQRKSHIPPGTIPPSLPPSYLRGTSKLIPGMSPLHSVGPPEDLSAPFARYSGLTPTEETRPRAESLGRIPPLFWKWDLAILSTLPKSAGKRRGDPRMGPACNKLRDFTISDYAIAFAIKSTTPIDAIRSWFYCRSRKIGLISRITGHNVSIKIVGRVRMISEEMLKRLERSNIYSRTCTRTIVYFARSRLIVRSRSALITRRNICDHDVG